MLVCLFVLVFNIPVNSYGHVGTMSSSNHTFSSQKGQLIWIYTVSDVRTVFDKNSLKLYENAEVNADIFESNLRKNIIEIGDLLKILTTAVF